MRLARCVALGAFAYNLGARDWRASVTWIALWAIVELAVRYGRPRSPENASEDNGDDGIAEPSFFHQVFERPFDRKRD